MILGRNFTVLREPALRTPTAVGYLVFNGPIQRSAIRSCLASWDNFGDAEHGVALRSQITWSNSIPKMTPPLHVWKKRTRPLGLRQQTTMDGEWTQTSWALTSHCTRFKIGQLHSFPDLRKTPLHEQKYMLSVPYLSLLSSLLRYAAQSHFYTRTQTKPH